MASSTPAHAQEITLLLSDLQTSLETGLSTKHVNHLQTSQGLNELAEQEGDPWWKKLLSQFNNYLVWILIAGAIVSSLAGELLDGILIIAIVVFMAVLGYIQDAKAEEALKNLKKLEARTTLVLRDGTEQTIDTRHVVPGDIVLLKAGDAIPADVRIIHAHNVTINEATLTGESLPTSKDARELPVHTPLAERHNMAYSGTLLLEGKLTGVVVATGMHTELGKIATLLQQTKPEPTPLEIQLEKLGKLLSIILLSLVILVLILNVVLRGEPLLEALVQSVALAIAAVPEGLPAVITICLAFGTQVMVKQQALVRKLKAVEALGSVSVIFTDKTGTLTTGNMSVTEVWSTTMLDAPSSQSRETNPLLGRLLRAAKLCNAHSNPTDQALMNWVQESGIEVPDIKKVFEYEFNSQLKRMSTVHDQGSQAKDAGDRYLVLTKGAPEMVLEHVSHLFTSANRRSALKPADRELIEQQLHDMASRGLRVLALAERSMPTYSTKAKRAEVTKDLTLIGLVGLSDPAKREVPAAIAATKAAGIRPIMMTGDNPITARTIALSIGLLDAQEAQNADVVMTGDQLDEAFAQKRFEAIMRVSVFARVSPSHKSILVDTFQRAGFLVAMVGDGVNDAPSIKAAHVGVAMGQRGSDVTKSAADLVLLDDKYSTLIEAIREGRNILHRIRLFVGYLLSCNFAEIGIFVGATIMGIPMPLTAVMLLLLNLVTDAAPAIAMSREPGDPELMLQPPRQMDEPIITRPMWFNIGAMTLITTVVVLVAYCFGLRQGELLQAETMAFVTLSFLELFRAFTARSLNKTAWELGFGSNPWIPRAVGLSTAITLAVVYLGYRVFDVTPLPLNLLAIAAGLALVAPILEELLKKTAFAARGSQKN